MGKINNQELLTSLKEDTQTLITIVEKGFMPLSLDVLHKNITANTWNIIECLEHTNLVANIYYPRIQAGIDSFLLKNKSGKLFTDYNSGFLGSYFARSMKPTAENQINSKVKTFKKIDPQRNGISYYKDKNAIDIFLKNQYLLIELMERSEGINLGGIKVNSLIGSIFKFKLGDVFQFLIAHNQRHVLQAQNVLEAQELRKEHIKTAV